MTLTDVPEDPHPWRVTHFQRHRSFEVAHSLRQYHWGDKSIEVSGLYGATKIGGLPMWQQAKEEANGMGVFFAAIQSMNPFGNEHPFPNLPMATWGEKQYGPGFLMMGDMGTLYLFWDGKRVNFLMQCG